MSRRKKPKTSKIRIKLFRAITAILIICLLFISVANRPILYRVLAYQTAQELITVSDSINALDENDVTYYFQLYTIAVNNNVSFEMLDSDGLLVYTSKNSDSALSSGHFPSSGSEGSEFAQTVRTELFNLSSSSAVFEKRQKLATSAEYFVLSCTLDSGLVLHAYSSVAVVDSNVTAAVNVFGVITIIICLLMSTVIYLFVSRFTKPLVEMNDVTKDMAALDFTRKCKHYGNDEIGELGVSINTLSDTLDSTLMDLKDKNEQLERDIERRHALDNARKSFIDNVSHELKTPIAIISGYAEGLSSGISDDPETINEYCKIISEESKKMNSLVVELLELSKLESKSQPFLPDTYNLGAQVNDLFNHFELLFRKHSISAENNVPADTVCFAQRDKIEIVLKNYLMNAISHCAGDRIIRIDIKDVGSNCRVSVFNTGDSISNTDINEIWDSFYRADKAHGRSENRFGLGLSIVKGIMMLHSMPYGVENVEGGVKFWFEISKGKINDETT